MSTPQTIKKGDPFQDRLYSIFWVFCKLQKRSPYKPFILGVIKRHCLCITHREWLDLYGRNRQTFNLYASLCHDIFLLCLNYKIIPSKIFYNFSTMYILPRYPFTVKKEFLFFYRFQFPMYFQPF